MWWWLLCAVLMLLVIAVVIDVLTAFDTGAPHPEGCKCGECVLRG